MQHTSYQCTTYGALSPSGRPFGIEKKKVEPLPKVLSTQIRPPCASTMPLVIGSPSPAPRRRALDAACQNRSKTCGKFSGAIPGPVSVTQNSTSPLWKKHQS